MMIQRKIEGFGLVLVSARSRDGVGADAGNGAGARRSNVFFFFKAKGARFCCRKRRRTMR